MIIVPSIKIYRPIYNIYLFNLQCSYTLPLNKQNMSSIIFNCSVVLTYITTSNFVFWCFIFFNVSIDSIRILIFIYVKTIFEVNAMYENLNQLINLSSSSRSYFLSLPVDIQMKLHNCSKHIHTAYDLHKYADFYSDKL